MSVVQISVEDPSSVNMATDLEQRCGLELGMSKGTPHKLLCETVAGLHHVCYDMHCLYIEATTPRCAS